MRPGHRTGPNRDTLDAMKTALSIALIVVLATVVSCSSVRTRYDFDPATDFSRWRTFAWYDGEPIPAGDPRVDSPLLHGRIVAAVEQVLGEQGFEQVGPDVVPDFYVNYNLSTTQRLQMRTINQSYRHGSSRHSWGSSGWGGVSWSQTRVDEVAEGTLVIDFLDVAARQLAWRGTGTRRLSGDPSADRITRRVNEAVDEILRRFPPSS